MRRLALAGRTNQEIGGELSISPRNVEWHLKSVFTKRGIGSRERLDDAAYRLARMPVAACLTARWRPGPEADPGSH